MGPIAHDIIAHEGCRRRVSTSYDCCLLLIWLAGPFFIPMTCQRARSNFFLQGSFLVWSFHFFLFESLSRVSMIYQEAVRSTYEKKNSHISLVSNRATGFHAESPESQYTHRRFPICLTKRFTCTSERYSRLCSISTKFGGNLTHIESILFFTPNDTKRKNNLDLVTHAMQGTCVKTTIQMYGAMIAGK